MVLGTAVLTAVQQQPVQAAADTELASAEPPLDPASAALSI